MKSALLSALCVLSLLGACTPSDDAADGGVDAAGGAGAGSGAGDGGASGDGTCWPGDDNDCNRCLRGACCAESTACLNDPTCVACNDMAPALRTQECWNHPLFDAARRCYARSECPAACEPGACGVFGVGETACAQCAIEQCCSQGRECADEADCTFCANVEPGSRPSECYQNPLLIDAMECVNGPCNEACNPPGSDGANCRAIVCSEGPAGDELCHNQGCGGGCFFGGCNSF